MKTWCSGIVFAAVIMLPPSSILAQDSGAAVPFQVEEIADFVAPWAMTFLDDGRMLITEKSGDLTLFDPESRMRIGVDGTPEVDSEGQGSLMDIVLHPQFPDNQLVFVSYSEARGKGRGVALASARFSQPDENSAALEDFKVIFRASHYTEGTYAYSGRIAFSPDGDYLFFSNGDRQLLDPAQDPNSTLGKVLRLNLDGTPAEDNPLSRDGFHPAIWSYGHRNLLGLAFDDQGQLWQQEMGPRGGDEINLIEPGRNYGWPRVSNGNHYSGRGIPDHAPGDGYEPPKVFWNPVISPSSMIHYTGKMFPEWKGSLFLGSLSGRALVRVNVEGTDAAKADQWNMGARIREVEQGPDGAIWLLEDGAPSQGRLLRLTPS